jgi:hypothetical protein
MRIPSPSAVVLAATGLTALGGCEAYYPGEVGRFQIATLPATRNLDGSVSSPRLFRLDTATGAVEVFAADSMDGVPPLLRAP